MFTIALQFFDATPEQKIDSAPDEKTTKNKPRAIRCSSCGHVIADTSARITVNEQHEHTRRNPAGFEFTFGCFRTAPGARGLGPASSEHTWFAGHTWQLLFCRACNRHLGWLFRNGNVFFALILNRLTFE